MSNTEVTPTRERPHSEFTRKAEALIAIARQAEGFQEQLCEHTTYEEKNNLTEIAITASRLATLLNTAHPEAFLIGLIDQLQDELSYFANQFKVIRKEQS